MRLWVATNWDEELLREALGKPVEGFFGALPGDPATGGGRPGTIIPKVGREEVAAYVRKLHEMGFKFAYAMGGPCLGNREYTPEGYREILEHLEWLCEIGTDYIIVSNPFLCELAKRKFPKLGVIVSVVAHVNTVNALKFWEDLGADVVNLDFMINRDFPTLRKLVEAASCEVELLLNDGCLLNCPYRISDYCFYSHASSAGGAYSGPMSYTDTRCPMNKLQDPAWLLRSPWIRPEDLAEYEKIGVRRFKISGREFTTEKLLKAMRMYSERRSFGNFAEILSGPPAFGHFPGIAKAIFLDAGALDGFLDFFKEGRCDHNCHICRWCDKWAERALKVNEGLRRALLEVMGEAIEAITGGDLERFMQFNEQVKMLGSSPEASRALFAEIEMKLGGG